VASTELRAEDIRWNLADLCEGAEQARTEWTALVAQAQELASRYRGTIASLDAPALRELFDAADALEQELSRLQVYSYLRLSMAATDVEANDLATVLRRSRTHSSFSASNGSRSTTSGRSSCSPPASSRPMRTSCASSGARSRTS